MKILYLTDQTYLHGGIEKVLTQKVNYLADVSGDQVTIATYNQHVKLPCYPLSEKVTLIDLGINYEIDKSYFSFENFKKVPNHINALKNIFKKLKPDVVISSSFGPDFYFLPFITTDIPKIKEFHSSRYDMQTKKLSWKNSLLNKFSAFVEKYYEQIVVLNASETSYFSSKNIMVIPNPSEVASEYSDGVSKKIMAAGRISPVKNFQDLITVFSRINKRFPDWELHIFGENYGETQESLQNIITNRGLHHQIIFKGVCADLKKEMKNYSIYAMTSVTECFPMVLLEALSVGLPVISYDCPTGPQHILIDKEDSFLIPDENLDIFTQKLEALMNDKNLRHKMGQKGIENVQRFGLEKVMAQWDILFKSLL